MTNYATAELAELFSRENLADSVVYLFDRWNNQRQVWMDEKEELRNFIFATDTTYTVGETTPWKNRTTLPKICQIRDNLHANYMSALFPNDDWLKWEAYSKDDNTAEKRNIIQAYISNKFREGKMRDVVSQLLYDYIDYGTPIADVEWVNESKVDPDTEEKIPGYVGPMIVRKSPIDVVFDPTAISFAASPKITRSLVRMGELKLMAMENGDQWIMEAIEYIENVRRNVGQLNADDIEKVTAYQVDGFGSLHEYYGSGFVEILELEGSVSDPDTGELLDDYIITVVDRQRVVRKQPIPSWKRNGMKVSTAWRKRPDNLYGMGPLDNLVGMQYRLDHLENAKADAWDLIINPMFKIQGGVEEFEFRPGGEVQCDPDGDVVPLVTPKEALVVNNEIATIMDWMEEFAGAPKQAMGIRTPGEKTAFEVQSLENAAGRIFQQKIVQFEVDILEPLLNNMLLMAVKNMNTSDIVRVLDDDLGVAQFTEITKQDITANGKIRPIGARHFSQRAQLIQNLSGITGSGMWPKIERHFSDMALAKLVEDSLQLERFSLVTDNASLFEQADAQRIGNQLQEDVGVEQATPIQEENL